MSTEDARINALRVRLWREEHPEAARASSRKAQARWRQRHREQARAESRARAAAWRNRKIIEEEKGRDG